MQKLITALTLAALAWSVPALAADGAGEITTGPWRPGKPAAATTVTAEVAIATGPVAPAKPGLRAPVVVPRIALTTGPVAQAKPGAAFPARR